MRLIIKQYLASLKERGELDAILPDLLSEMGLTVFASPRRGTREYGVDIGAVGRIGTEEESVYLLSVKSGNLTRSEWNGNHDQALRPSLDDIRDVYVKQQLPVEHRSKPVVICLCFGGDIQTQIRASVEGYIEDNRRDGIRYEQWNGDYISGLIETHMLSEALLPKGVRSDLRKALALLDEPAASFRHFGNLVQSICTHDYPTDKERLAGVRRLAICLWIVYAWAREAENLEAAYLEAELTLLNGWELCKSNLPREGKRPNAYFDALEAIHQSYLGVSLDYANRVIPYVAIPHGVSHESMGAGSVGVNRKLFDVLGRLAMNGIHAYSLIPQDELMSPNDSLPRERSRAIVMAVVELIQSNPCLYSPISDDNAIDIFLAAYLLFEHLDARPFLGDWLSEMWGRSMISFQCHTQYPCMMKDYKQLARHPEAKTDEHRESVTASSVLYPTIAFWAALLGHDELYNDIRAANIELLTHCNFQYWYPDSASEEFLYDDQGLHGACVTDLSVDRTPSEFAEYLWRECDVIDGYDSLSAIEAGFPFLILIACRHYRLPIPIQFTLGYRDYVCRDIDSDSPPPAND